MNTFPRIRFVSLRQAFINLISRWVSVFSPPASLVAMLILLVFSTSIQAQSLSVSMSFPSFRTSFLTGTPVNIQATATTPPGTSITKVEFFLANFATGPKTTVKLGEATTAPYSYTWTIPDGQVSYNELSVKVTNSTGATAVQGGTGYIRVDVYAPTTASNKKYYVKAGPTNGNGLSPATPFNTIQAAQELVQPGDSVFVMAGTYQNTGTNDAVVIRRTGTPTNWIVFTNYQNDRPKISFNGYQGFNLVPGAAYIKIQGFDIEGNNANITLPQATTQPGSCDNPTGTPNPVFNGNGISLNGRTGGNVRPHHVVIANNTVHDCPGGGVITIESDYVTVENNTVYNNSWYTIFGTSGISFLNGWNYDNNTDTPKMIVRNNVCYGNRLFVKWITGGVCRGITDGNGIILDNNNNQFGTTNPNGAYNGKFLIENNVCYQNGGRGVNINYSDNATVRNNTFYQNAASPEITSEFAMRYSASVRIYNNIFYTRSDKATGAPVNSANLLQSNNLTFGGTDTPFFTGPQSLTGVDPQFVDAANGNFQLMATSPAVNAGSNTPGQYAAKDILGIDRPQGSSTDIGAYEFQGTPVSIAQQPASSSAVCVGSPVSISVGIDGPVQAYQWYKDGNAITDVSSATTATLSLAAVTTTDQGNYFAVITGFNSLTSSVFSLTVNAIPDAPTVSSLTTTQGTSNVSLTATNCAGTLNWNGVDAGTPFPVSTTAVGDFVYTVACRVGTCVSPVTSVTVTVQARPATLTISYRDADNNQLTNNTIRPYLKLNNEGTTPISYGDITIRYWLTVEDFSPLTNLSIYWAQVGTSKVKMKYVSLAQPRQGALGYIEYSFDASAGSLAAGSNSGEIQTGVGKQNWTNFNESDDYSFAPNAAYARTDRITVYQNGALVGGTEPVVSTPITALKVYAQNRNSNPTTNQISTYLKVANEGNLPVDYSQLTIRYWFSSEGTQPLVYNLDYAELGGSNIKSKFVKENRAGTDTYLELSFVPSLGQLNALSTTGIIQQRINKSDWSNFNSANDYSYKPAGALTENATITAYLNGSLVYGQEPGPSGARLGREPSGLRVVVFGNPVRGDAVNVAVSGAEGQALQIELVDAGGKLITGHQIEQAGLLEDVRLSLGQLSGITFLLRVSTPTESQTLKLIKQ